MARCTLDDLVPRFKCNRIFLEPLQGNYIEYKVQIDASVYDTIDDEDGIADYLFSHSFKQYINIIVVFCRSTLTADFNSYINSLFTGNGLLRNSHVAMKSFIFFQVLKQAIQTQSSGQQMTFADFVANITALAVTNGTALSNSPTLQVRLYEYYKEIRLGLQQGTIHAKPIGFATYTNQYIDDYGTRTQDVDGNIYYDLKIDRSELTFMNAVDVQDCYLHSVSYFNAQDVINDALQAQNQPLITIPLDNDTLPFFFNQVDECHILRGRIAASPIVQDFRLVERLEEIMDLNATTIYDTIIDNLSSLPNTTDIEFHGITSDLYSSYMHTNRNTANQLPLVYTHSVFYFNMMRLLLRKTRYKFMYTNLIKSAATNSTIAQLVKNEIISAARFVEIKINRCRLDVYESKVQIADKDTITLTPAGYQAGATVALEFEDSGFKDLTYGKYGYEAEMFIIDPIFNLAEKGLFELKKQVAAYQKAIDYIHNNPGNYNELRDELNSTAQNAIATIFNNALISHHDIRNLCVMLFGFTFNQLEMAMGLAIQLGANISDSEVVFSPALYERRKLESGYKVLSDLLFAASKFFEVPAVNFASTTTVQSNKELITYKRKWDVEMDPQKLEEGIIDIFPTADFTLSDSQYLSRAEHELDKFNITNLPNPVNIGFFTPLGINGKGMEGGAGQHVQVFYHLFSNVLETPQQAETEAIYTQKLIDNINQNESAEVSMKELENNSGLFETFLHTLGGTCDNLGLVEGALSSDRIPELGNAQRMSISIGIDVGENVRDSGDLENNEPIGLGDDEEDLSPEEQDQDTASEGLILEATKREDIIMNYILHTDGYSAMDRMIFHQGTSRSRELRTPNPGIDALQLHYQLVNKPYPLYYKNYNLTEHIIRKGITGMGRSSNIVFFRFILDNTFLVYYVSGFDNSMNPVWKHMTSITSVQALNSAIGLGDKVLCKLVRFKEQRFNAGLGSTSDREIFQKYFYLSL